MFPKIENNFPRNETSLQSHVSLIPTLNLILLNTNSIHTSDTSLSFSVCTIFQEEMYNFLLTPFSIPYPLCSLAHSH